MISWARDMFRPQSCSSLHHYILIFLRPACSNQYDVRESENEQPVFVEKGQLQDPRSIHKSLVDGVLSPPTPPNLNR